MIDLIERLNKLKNENFIPKSFLDIGANFGEYSKMIKNIWTDTEVFMIDANPFNEKYLKNVGYKYLISLLTDKIDETYDFYLNKTDINSTGCSIYKENTSHFSNENLDIIKLKSNTLDNMFKDQEFDLIKLDTQGSEIDILKGGLNLISKSKYIIIEASIVNYNLNAPLIDDVLNFMTSVNYKMIDIIELHYIDNILIQVDILFKNNKLKNIDISYNNYWNKDHNSNVLDLLKNSNFNRVIDIGPSNNFWSKEYVTHYIDINKIDNCNSIGFIGDICINSTWEKVLNDVELNGKYDFVICTHTLEDISSPKLVIEMINKIGKSGFISFPSKNVELQKNIEGNYCGHIHHRWIYNIENNKCVAYPKLSFIENMDWSSILDKYKNKNITEIQFFWNNKLNVEFMNNDYMGPDPSSVYKYFQSLNND